MMIEMGIFLKRIRWGLALVSIITAPMSVDAACRVVGTAPPEGGYIIVCDESDTTGITGSDFRDIITVESGAEVSKTVQQTGTSSVHADAIVLDAGRGNDTVMNLGAIDASA
ncbi:MAG: hypothetical protein LLG43_10085, partial [Deltaproteobacteria bacterium]|nr:hypothetical protein [Deltaproteobacteria bacterium]